MDSSAPEEPVDDVPGVLEARAEGFEPLTEHTGLLFVGEVWPDAHRRCVPETRASMRELEPELRGRLWLVRSPWQGWTLPETLNAMWRWLESGGAPRGGDLLDDMNGAADFLRWDESAAAIWR